MCPVMTMSHTFSEPAKSKDGLNFSEPLTSTELSPLAMLTHMKIMNLSRKICALVVGAPPEGSNSNCSSSEFGRGYSETEKSESPSNPKRKLLSPSGSSRSSSGRSLRLGHSKRSFSSSSRSLDRSRDRSGSEIDTEDPYSNSNVSSSRAVEEYYRDQWVDSPRKPKPPRSILGRSTSSDKYDGVPEGHLIVYVGSSTKRRFVVSTQVVTHRLFKQLLESDYFTVEENDGNSSIVLLCDADYFQRLLFLIEHERDSNRTELVLA